MELHYIFSKDYLSALIAPLLFFSRRMASILTLVKQGCVRIYLDDLILWAPDFQELLSRVKQLFNLLTDHRVKLYLSKCTFGLKEVTFLGHRISPRVASQTLRISRQWPKWEPPRPWKRLDVSLVCVDFTGNMFHHLLKLPPHSLTSLAQIQPSNERSRVSSHLNNSKFA